MLIPMSCAPSIASAFARPEFVYVGLWARVAAAWIDALVLLLAMLPLSYLVYGRFSPPLSSAVLQPMDIFTNILLPAAIVVCLWSRGQATPGKWAMSARIVDADSGGNPTFRQYVIRYIGYFASMLPLGLGILWIGFDRRKQGWHDKMANTVVVRRLHENTLLF